MASQRRKLKVTKAAEQGDLLCLQVWGDVVRDRVNPPPDPLVDFLGTRGHGVKVLFDLTETDFIDSSGYTWLLNHNTAFREAGGAMVLHSVPPMVKVFLDTVRAELEIAIASDESAARQMLRKEPA